jgi:hypothetical protein
VPTQKQQPAPARLPIRTRRTLNLFMMFAPLVAAPPSWSRAISTATRRRRSMRPFRLRKAAVWSSALPGTPSRNTGNWLDLTDVEHGVPGHATYRPAASRAGKPGGSLRLGSVTATAVTPKPAGTAQPKVPAYPSETCGGRAPGARPLAVRLLLVEHLDVAQMARSVARPPDAVRVGWIDFNPSRIRL